jgi:hypothetical protein
MTAVEWLANELYEKFEMKGDGALFNDLLNQSKEMEKQQIIDACNNAQITDFYVKYYDTEEYYNETFKNK